MNNFIKNNSSWIIALLIALIVGLTVYFSYEIKKKQKKIDEIEYTDTNGTYHKEYYETKFKELKKSNKELHDSLKQYKDKIDFLVQFTSKQEYNTGKVIIKKQTVHDTVYVDSLQFADSKTFEYTNANPNDTMTYKLQINAKEEPNWYSLNIKTNTQYTIVNKEGENGQNHITIGDNTHSADITDVTVFKKKKKTFWSRFGVGPSITAGYDLTHKEWGIMAGASVTYDLTK